jgi:hypothetical protein
MFLPGYGPRVIADWANIFSLHKFFPFIILDFHSTGWRKPKPMTLASHSLGVGHGMSTKIGQHF